ncbi:MAG: DUF1778 domain-containing protein [Myxococcales bacterium]|nr:DUF1778 domain-containing protein [Myxococcales bacterium]
MRAARKEHPLSMRLPVSDVELIDRAAGINGCSRTEFVREAAVRAAEGVLLDRALMRLSPAAFGAFARAVAGPGRPVRELVAVLKRKAPWE